MIVRCSPKRALQCVLIIAISEASTVKTSKHVKTLSQNQTSERTLTQNY